MKLIKIIKHFNGGKKEHFLTLTDDVSELDIQNEVEFWAKQDNSNGNVGYNLEWSTITDPLIIVNVLCDRITNLTNKIDNLIEQPKTYETKSSMIVKDIDVLPDGGSLAITYKDSVIYLNKEGDSFHYNWPLNDANKIADRERLTAIRNSLRNYLTNSNEGREDVKFKILKAIR